MKLSKNPMNWNQPKEIFTKKKDISQESDSFERTSSSLDL